MKIPNKCGACGYTRLEVTKTYCGTKVYTNGKPESNKPYPKILAKTDIFCPCCNWETEI